MESALSRGCNLKLQNFEGPFDLLFHLIEKNKIDIYDIPINDITDQYMDYLFAMREMDMEIASEFLVMAATLLHIKSKMLLPKINRVEEDDEDPREELILRLLEYKKYKEYSTKLMGQEKSWEGACYKMPEFMGIRQEPEFMEMSPTLLGSVYLKLLNTYKEKMNNNAGKMKSILKREQVTLKSKIREIIGIIIKNSRFVFSEIFSLKRRSKTEVVTGFLAILELAKLRKLKIEQKTKFSDIIVSKTDKEDLSYIPVSGDVDGY